MRRVWGKVVKFSKAITLAIMMIYITLACAMGFFNDKLLLNSVYINRLQTLLGLLAVPGITIQLSSMMFDKKQKFIGKINCSKCGEESSITLIEEL